VPPAGHVWFAAIEVLAPATLTEVESILHEETMAISGTMTTLSHATRTYNSPSFPSVWTMVPEEHPSMTTTLEHLQPHKTPSSTNMPSSLPIAPTVQAIVINCIPIVDPQLAPIIGVKAEVVMASPEDSQAACPTHSKVIASRKSRPPAACVAIVHCMAPTSHIWPATIQILAPTALSEIEGILPEEAVTISCAIHSAFPAAGT
jgi:hypothetical protein